MSEVTSPLTFDKDSHTYRWQGVLVPNVTRLLQALHSFADVPLDILEAAQDRGTDVHSMTQMFDEDDLDEARLKIERPDLHTYLAGYRKFLRDATPNWRSIEEPVFHRTLRYATTPDRIGEIKFEGKRVPDAVVEIKTSLSSHPVWGIQTAAQANAAGRPTARRFSLQLFPDATYKLREWPDPDDWPAFVSLVTLNTWKIRNHL